MIYTVFNNYKYKIFSINSLVLLIGLNIGCYNNKLLSENSNALILSNKNEKIIISKNKYIIVEWFDDNQNFNTSAKLKNLNKNKIHTVEEQLVTVNIKEIKNDYICLRSHAWRSRENLPSKYSEFGPDSYINGFKKPSIIIPLNQIQCIYIYDRKYTIKDLFNTPKYILLGAVSGRLIFGSNIIKNTISKEQEYGKTNINVINIISSSFTGALLGSIIYPIYKYFDISFGYEVGEKIKKHTSMYLINQSISGYKIELDKTQLHN